MLSVPVALRGLLHSGYHGNRLTQQYPAIPDGCSHVLYFAQLYSLASCFRMSSGFHHSLHSKNKVQVVKIKFRSPKINVLSMNGA